jgi:hypothetical protein
MITKGDHIDPDIAMKIAAITGSIIARSGSDEAIQRRR